MDRTDTNLQAGCSLIAVEHECLRREAGTQFKGEFNVERFVRASARAFAMIVILALTAVSALAAEPLSVRLDFSPVGFHAAMHLAKVKGWFAREGLDVDIQDGTGSLNTIQLVASGQADVGQVQLGVMAIARQNGLPLKSFAGFLRKGDLAVLVPRGSNIHTVKDLRGKKLVCFTASPWAPFIDPFLAKGGLDRTSVQIDMVSPSAMAPLYVAKEADGIMTVEPAYVPIVEKTRPAQTIRLADYGISFPSYGLIATEATIAKRPAALTKLAKVEIEAWNYIWQDPAHVDEAVQAVIDDRPNIKLDRAVLKGQLELNKPFFYTDATKNKPIGWQATKDWEDALKSMKDAGAIKNVSDPKDYFTNGLLPQ
jgi:NitT/TauT family transport system substrate-binding protein